MVSECEVPLIVQTSHHHTGRTIVASGGVEYSLRRWSCTVLEGRARAASSTRLPHIREVVFVLHETFDSPRRVVRSPPFRVEEQGWGEFDLEIIVHFAGCSDHARIVHDLNFQEGDQYDKRYRLTIANPTPGFLALFNENTTLSRKTIPARETKARKAPPRSAQNPAARRGRSSSLSSDGSGSESDTSSSLSDSSGPRSTPSRHHSRSSASTASRKHQHTGERLSRKPAASARPPSPPAEDRRPWRQRSPARAHHAHPPDRAAATAPRRTSQSPPARGAALGSAGLKQRQRRTSDAPETLAAAASRRRTTGSGDLAYMASKSPQVSPGLAAVKRPPAIGTSGIKVPKKRARPADDLPDRPKQPRGERPAAAEPGFADEDVTPLRLAKRPKPQSAKAARATEGRRQPSSSASPPPSQPRARPAQPTQPAADRQAGAATSSREEFIRERERRRRLDSGRDPASAPSTSSSAASQRAGAGLGLLGKAGRVGMAAARVRTTAVEPEKAPVDPAPPRKLPKRDIAAIAVPKLSQKHASAAKPPAAAAAAAAADSPAPPAAPPARAKRLQKTSSAESRGSDSSDGGDGSAADLPPGVVHKLEQIAERARRLSDQSMVRFLRLLHSLRVEQEPETAVAITEAAVDQIERAGAYSCNLATLAPEAIDRLWAFVV
ncbi:transcription factor TFIIF complex subunit Tfg3 [Coemansia javaensis]|uniref:Transcription factor TFIIF complex subunit Tfg3 n=1 Tax=Coemansia javaensis TaxID=2761396 RepID=A0A9W8LJQ4_9FUNG|nr:transcription factor TFIIF complex subunit Tfg3 [Coemansia javaensis]